MTLNFRESLTSPNVRNRDDGSEVERSWVLWGTTSASVVSLATLSLAGMSYGGLPRNEYSVEPIAEDWEGWTGRALYRTPKPTSWGGVPREIGDSAISFDIQTETLLVKSSLSTVSAYTLSTAPAIDFGGSINVTENGVEGIDILRPSYKFQVDKVVATATVGESYRTVLKNTVGKFNDASYRGFAAGEVFLLGAVGKPRQTSDYTVTLYFAVRPNETNVDIGGITVASIAGWDVVWSYSKQQRDPTTNYVVPQPIQVNVERVYQSADFSALDP